MLCTRSLKASRFQSAAVTPPAWRTQDRSQMGTPVFSHAMRRQKAGERRRRKRAKRKRRLPSSAAVPRTERNSLKQTRPFHAATPRTGASRNQIHTRRRGRFPLTRNRQKERGLNSGNAAPGTPTPERQRRRLRFRGLVMRPFQKAGRVTSRPPPTPAQSQCPQADSAISFPAGWIMGFCFGLSDWLSGFQLPVLLRLSER